MTTEPDLAETSDEIEVAKTRIDWAHQRQLATVGALLGLGIGVVECLLTNLQDVGLTPYIFIYFTLLSLFLTGLYFFFNLEHEILRWQYRIKNAYRVNFKESLFRHFIDCTKEQTPLRENTLIPAFFAVFALFSLLLIARVCDSSIVNIGVAFNLIVLLSSVVIMLFFKSKNKS
jgi:hypothetical protein